jgi:hypothetical protein
LGKRIVFLTAGLMGEIVGESISGRQALMIVGLPRVNERIGKDSFPM